MPKIELEMQDENEKGVNLEYTVKTKTVRRIVLWTVRWKIRCNQYQHHYQYIIYINIYKYMVRPVDNPMDSPPDKNSQLTLPGRRLEKAIFHSISFVK